MPNNNVAILSIMSKFDEKSAREAAQRANKVYDEALSDIGNVNFDKKLLENFDKAMNLLKNKFKKVNLSSYTNNLLDSIFSDKDIATKSKDIESFIKKIDLLKKASSGQDINAFNTFSAKQIEALISRTEKLAQKQDEINEKIREYNREATKIAKTNRSISTIDKNYGNQDYTKTLESLKISLGTEKEFTAEQNQSIENLAKMVNLYQVMEKSEPQKGTAEAIRYSKDLLAVTQKIKEERDKIDAFSQKGASAYITNNDLSSIDKVSDYTVNKVKDDFIKASLSNLKAQEAKLQSELTTYISDSVQKNLAKVSKEADAVIDKAEKRVENLQNKIDSLQSKPANTGTDNSLIGNIVSESDVKSLEEIEDRLYAISDLDAEGEATSKQLKEYIQLYKQYEQLISGDSTVKFDPSLKEEYDSIIESDSKLKKYADTLDETIVKQKELNATKSDEKNTSTSVETEQLAKQEEQIKQTVQAEEKLIDTQNQLSSNTKISVDVEQAIVDINKVKENLESIPDEKKIKISVNDNDYTNTPLLSDAEGNTITAFRGVVGAWSGLINQDGIGFFTDKLKLAADYADSLAESGKVYQANLSFKNPLEVEGNGAKWDEIDFNGVKKTTDEIVELAKQLGHDGVIFKNIRDGFTDTEEDISNVMVALNAAQIKNEQVIGTVKAGTGEMVDVASKTNNTTDTATNSTVESQNKIQEELKETQKVAEQVSEAMSNVSSDKSNISSENPVVESQNKIQEELRQTQEQAEKSLLSIKELYNVLKQDIGSTNDREKFAIGNSSTGLFSMPNLGTDYDFISEDLIYSAIEKSKEQIDSLIHTHSEKIAAFSPDDIYAAIEEMEKGIIHQYVKGMDEVTHIDFSQLSKKQWTLVARNFEERFEKLVDTDGWYEDEDVSQEIQDNFQKKMKQILESLIAFYLPKDKSLTDVINTQQIENITSPIEEYTSPGNSYVIENQNKIQEELKQTQEQAEQTAKAVQNVSETQIKDVIHSDAEKSGMDNIASATEEAVRAKKDFATANEGVQSSVDGSKSKLELEAELMNQIAKSAREVVDAKKEFVKANIEVKASAESSNNETKKYNTEENANAWKELSYSIQRYSEVSKRISSGKIFDGDVEEAERLENKISQLQKLDVLSPTQIEKSEQMLVKLYDKLDDIEKKSKKTSLESMQSKLNSYNNKVPEKPIEKNSKFQAAIDNYKNAIREAQTYLDNLWNTPITEEQTKQWKILTDNIEEANKKMESFSAAERGSDALSRSKEIDTITKYLDKFTGISKQAKQELNGLLDKLKSGDPSVNVKKIHERFLELTVSERNAGREARGFFDIFKDKKLYSFLGQAASMFSFYDLIRYGREGIDTIREFDDGLTKISYTMDITKSQLNDLGKSVLDMANDLDSSINNAMQVSQIYANMNTSAEEIKKLSEPTLILSNLTGFDASTVADDIQAVTQQFDIAAESSMHIADVYDQISRNISVDYSKGIESIAEAVQVAGSTADQAGLSFEQLASIVGKTVEKTRLEGSQVGNGLKTIMTRLSKVGELSEEVDNETLSQASESLKKVGIEVYNLDGSYRQFDVIMGELEGKWDSLTDAEKSNISFNIAATRQTNLLSAVLSNFSDSMQLAEEATNANGNALENNQKWVDSFGGHLQSLENTAKSAWINILDSETIKGGVDILNSLLKVVVGLIDKFGVLGTTAIVGGGILGGKNLGKTYKCTVFKLNCFEYALYA